MLRNLPVLVFGFLLLAGICFSFSDLGGGICECDSCSDCTDALNDTSACTSEVRANASINMGGTCINGSAGFENKTFDCQGNYLWSTTQYGIYVSGNTNGTIENCVINSTGIGIYLSSATLFSVVNNTIPSGGTYGIYLNGGGNHTLTSNTVYSVSGDGVKAASSSYNNLTSNTIHSNTGDGMHFSGDCDYNTFTSNIVYNNSEDGFLVVGVSPMPDYNSFINNTAYNNSNSGFHFYETAPTCHTNITNNTAYLNEYFGFYLQGSAHNILSGNTAHSNALSGFLLSEGSENNSLASNIAYNNSDYGFYVGSSPYNNFTSNTAYNNSDHGFYLSGSDGNRFSANTAYDNTVGFILENSDSNNFSMDVAYSNVGGFAALDSDSLWSSGLHLYANPLALVLITSEEASPADASMYETIFDSQGGGYSSYSNITIEDTLAAHTAYMVNWSASPAGVPSGHAVFAGKTVNITILNGSSSIDNVTWNWKDSESSGYDESNFAIWAYSGSWAEQSADSNTSANTLNMSISSDGIYSIFTDAAASDDGGSDADYECITSSDCPPCFICRSHECALPPGDEDACSSDSDCPAGYVCEECACTGGCTYDSDCPGMGETCVEGECLPPECMTDEGCSGVGETCVNYECLPPECLSDSDCPDGYECTEYSCTQREEEPPGNEPGEEPECASDSDCAEGFACIMQECVEQEQPPEPPQGNQTPSQNGSSAVSGENQAAGSGEGGEGLEGSSNPLADIAGSPWFLALLLLIAAALVYYFFFMGRGATGSAGGGGSKGKLYKYKK